MQQQDPYAAIAKPVSNDPYAGIAAPEQPTKTLFQTMKDNFNANTQHVPTTGLKSIIQNFGAGGGDVIRSIPHMFDSAPKETLQQQADRLVEQGRQTLSDPIAALASTAGQMGTGLLLGEGAKAIPGAVKAIPQTAGKVVRAPFTTAINDPIIGTSTTPAARYAAAKRLGVNLDLADATNSAVPKALKSINSDSLAGQHVYEATKGKNLAALNQATQGTLDAMSPYDRETGGATLQQGLQANQQSLKSLSDTGHEAVRNQYGNLPVADPATLSKVASDIEASQAQHLKEFPSLKPSRVAAVVNDAAKFGKNPDTAPKMSGLVDEFGKPLASITKPTTPIPTVGNALKARSGILDMYQNNPELVKSSSDAQLQRLVGATHDTVMNSLPESGQKTLRDAQLAFKEMKQVYDNPSSPYYDAVRTPNPSSKVTGIGPQTPESVRDLMARAGQEGTGVLQRGVTEKALGTTPGGDFNFRSFPNQFAKLPSAYKGELFGPKTLETPRTEMTPFGPKLEYSSPDYLGKLNDISDTSQALAKDLNPSGTAKQGQKLAEAVGMIPSAGLPLLQYPLARFMNSPAIIDFMMKQNAVPAIPSSKLTAAPFIFPSSKKNGTR